MHKGLNVHEGPFCTKSQVCIGENIDQSKVKLAKELKNTKQIIIKI